MFPVHQVWPKPSCKAQWKGEEYKADRGRSGKTTSGNGQAWSSASPRGQWRTGKNGENWLHNYLWCPNDPDYVSQALIVIGLKNYVLAYSCVPFLDLIYAHFLSVLLL